MVKKSRKGYRSNKASRKSRKSRKKKCHQVKSPCQCHRS